MCTSSHQIPVQVLQDTQKSLSILRNNSESFVNVHLRLKQKNLSMTEVYSTFTILHWRKVLKVTILFYVLCTCSGKLFNWQFHCKLNGKDSVNNIYLYIVANKMENKNLNSKDLTNLGCLYYEVPEIN